MLNIPLILMRYKALASDYHNCWCLYFFSHLLLRKQLSNTLATVSNILSYFSYLRKLWIWTAICLRYITSVICSTIKFWITGKTRTSVTHKKNAKPSVYERMQCPEPGSTKDILSMHKHWCQMRKITDIARINNLTKKANMSSSR